jgi:Lrp/AsnC family transcriptional regulator, leucine-responsive regulatory protein
VVPSLAVYEEVLLDHILAIEGVTSVRSSFALRTVLSRGPLPLGRPR